MDPGEGLVLDVAEGLLGDCCDDAAQLVQKRQRGVDLGDAVELGQHGGQVFFGVVEGDVGGKKSTASAWLTCVSLTRRPSAARIKMLASMTRRRRCQSGTIDGP